MKRGVTLLVCLVLLGGLIGAYFYLGKHPAAGSSAQPSASPDTTVKLIDKKKWDVQSIQFLADGNEMTVLPVINPTPTPRPTPTPLPADASPTPAPSETPTPSPTPTPDISFTVSGYQDAALDFTSVNNMANFAYSLNASEKITDNGDPKDYGLDPPKSEIDVKYTDGTDQTIYVGSQTPAKDNYYAMVKGDPAIYTITTSVGDPAFYTLDNVLSKVLPSIDGNSLEYIYVKLKDKDPIEFAFDGTQDQLDTAMQQYGSVTLTMVQPYKGWQFYGSNFQSSVLDGMSGITMGNMVEANPTDYAKYGLDDPSLEFWLKDANGEMHLDVGSDADQADVKSVGDSTAATASADTKTYVYVKFADRAPVYVMDKSYLTTLYSINVFNFTEKFVEIPNINNVSEITLKSADKDYDLTLNHELVPVTPTPTPTNTPTPTPDPNAPAESSPPAPDVTDTPAPTPTPQDVIHPKVNGQDVQDKAFRAFYQVLIGLQYDTNIDTFTPTDLPEVTITYMMNNGDPDVTTKYYKYNNDFYAVQKDDAPIQFVVSKQYVDSMFQSLEDLLAGKLDQS